MPTFPGGSEVKASASSLGREDPLEKEMATHSSILAWRPVLLPGKPHVQRSLVDYSPWGSKELDMTE